MHTDNANKINNAHLSDSRAHSFDNRSSRYVRDTRVHGQPDTSF